MAGRSGSVRSALAVCAAGIVALGGAVFAPNVAAQDCSGSISTSVATDSLPGGEWSVDNGCLPPETFFEYSDGAVHAQAAVSTVTYEDGHKGRVAAGILTLGGDLGLSIVGVEDSATGLVKWSAVLGDYSAQGDTVSVSGEGVSLFPTEKASVSVSISGTGTDVRDLLEDGSTTETTVSATADSTTRSQPADALSLPSSSPGGTPAAAPTTAPSRSDASSGNSTPDQQQGADAATTTTVIRTDDSQPGQG